MPELVPGTPYVLRELLGAGRTGQVHRAVDVRDGREVAVKRGASAREHALLVRVAERSAAAPARVVRPIAFHVAPDGATYLAMELVRGVPLTTYAGDRAAALAQLRALVGWLHGIGVVHHDLAPANVIVGDDGRITLLDFGHARELVDPADADTDRARLAALT